MTIFRQLSKTLSGATMSTNTDTNTTNVGDDDDDEVTPIITTKRQASSSVTTTPSTRVISPSPLLGEARETAFRLAEILKCQACNSNLVDSGGTVWRSKNCEHLFCQICAMSKAKRMGSCPVTWCRVPLQPVDVVQDFVTGQIVEACSKLAEWAKEYGGSRERRTNDKNNEDDDDDEENENNGCGNNNNNNNNGFVQHQHQKTSRKISF